MSEVLARVFLAGRARTKGSLAPKITRNGRGQMKVVQQDTPQSTAWKQSMVKQLRELVGIEVARVAGAVMRIDAEPYAGPVEVHRFFRFAPAPGWPSHETEWPVAVDIGDVDKLTRNLLDALQQAGVIADDRNVIGGAELKRWCKPGEEPGVEILVRAASVWATSVERILLGSDDA